MDSLEQMIVRFYDNTIVLSKEERSHIERGMVSFTEDIANIKQAFLYLEIHPSRDSAVYLFASNSIYKMIRNNFVQFDEALKNFLRDELFKKLLEFGKLPNQSNVCNRLLMCISAFVVRSTHFWPSSLKDGFRVIFSDAKNQEWIFRFFTNVAEEYSDLKGSRTEIYNILTESNQNLIKFISGALPSLTTSDSSYYAIRCLEVWAVKFEIDDPNLVDTIIETLLQALIRPHQSESAETSLCKIFEQPVFEKSDNLFQMMFHEMFGHLQPVVEAKLKEDDSGEHLKNIFSFFLQMGKSHFQILYKMEDSVRIPVVGSYLDIVVRCTPVCVKNVDPNILFDFWIKIFTEHIENPGEMFMKMLDEVCITVVKQTIVYAKYSLEYHRLSSCNQDLFKVYRKALAGAFHAFYNQIGKKLFELMINLLTQANGAFHQGRQDWITFLELAIFFCTEIDVNAKQDNTDIQTVFDAITGIPFELFNSFPPIFNTILRFLKQYVNLFNTDAMKNRKLFELITRFLKSGHQELAERSIPILNLLTDNGFEFVEPFQSELAQFHHEAINSSYLSMNLKLDLVGSFCHLICLASADVTLNSMKTVIFPFLEQLKNDAQSSSSDAHKVTTLLRLYSTIFEKMENPNFVAELFDFFEHMRQDLFVFVDRFRDSPNVLEGVCHCVQAYLLNIGPAAQEHFLPISKLLVHINNCHRLAHVLKTIRICLSQFPEAEIFVEAFIDILAAIHKSFDQNFVDDPEFMEVFFDEMSNIIRKTSCSLPVQMWSSILGFSAQAIALSEVSPARSAAFFLRNFVQAVEKDPAIQSVFQKHFQQLVDIMFQILINPNSFSGSIELVCDTFFLFKKSFPSNFLIAIKSNMEPTVKSEEKAKLQKLIPTCTSKQTMKNLLMDFSQAHQNL